MTILKHIDVNFPEKQFINHVGEVIGEKNANNKKTLRFNIIRP